MGTFEDGSAVWARSGKKQKYWPSLVFRTWRAAMDEGLVPDGIAYVIGAGRKIDTADEDAAPREGELLTMYLGDNPEWDFIPNHKDYLLPYLENREKYFKQRLGAQLKHQFGPALAAADAWCRGEKLRLGGPSHPESIMNGTRTSALLDFGSGTSFASFAELWNYLVHNGWQSVRGRGLVSWYYYPPGTDPRTPNLILDTDYFDSEDAVITHVRDKGLERPAPVSAVLARSKGAAKTRSSETGAPEAEASEGGGASEAKSSAGRSSKRAGRSGTGAKQKSKSASSRSRKSRPSSEVDGHGSGKAEANGAGERAKAGGGSGEGDDDPWVSNGVVGPDGVVDGGDGDGHGSGDADGCIEEDTRDGQAEESRGDKAADAAVDEASGGTGAAGDSSGRDAGKEGAEDVEQDAALGFDFENGEEKPVSHGLVRDLAAGRPEAGDQTDSSTVDAQVSDGNRASDGRCRSKRGSVGGSERSKAAGVGPAAAAEACAGSKRDRSGRRSAQSAQESQGGSVRRSHGRTMQSEAIHASSRNNGGDSRVPVEATRQTVAMRELASSPPAPSPSKRPKRSGSHLPPQELSRLANKQIKHLRALVDGTERPFRGPIGLDGPISTLTKFIKDNHSTWLACQPGPKNSNTASMTGARRQGALILAGPGGTGKTTVFTSAMSSCAKMASSPRFVTIRCTTGGGADGDGGREVVEQARIYSKVLAAVTGKNRRLDGNKPLEELEKMAVPSYPVVLCMEEGDALDRTLLSSLMNMAYRDRPLFSMVVMARSVDVGYEVGFEQGMRNRDVVMVPMLPYPEDTIRSILGQAMGAADEEDLDGAMVATLVNKGALDVIAKTVARVCGSARIALNVCIVALVERTKELAKDPAGVAGSTLASGANHLGGGGVASSSSRGTAGGAPTSPGHAARHSALMNITGAKNALNKLLQLGFDATGESTAESTSEAKEEIAHAPMG